MDEKIKYRKIIHVDMDAFFASIEQRDFPEYRGKPLAVGGGENRGVIAAASYEARKFGVFSAMPSKTAKQLCPDLIFAKPRFEVYKEVSNIVMDIFRNVTPLVEALSIDEAYLDVTENLLNEPFAVEIAKKIKDEIWKQTNLTASAGVSYNKFLAKIASDINKPNGIKVIHPDVAFQLIAELPIKKFYGIGKVTADKLKQRGFSVGADLQALDLMQMEALFGKMGYYFYQICRGVDDRKVKSSYEAKSIGAEETFSVDLVSIDEIIIQFEKIAIKIANRLAKKNKVGKHISIKVRHADFSTYTRSKLLDTYLHSSSQILSHAIELFNQFWDNETPIRLIGITISNLESATNSNLQLALWDI